MMSVMGDDPVRGGLPEASFGVGDDALQRATGRDHAAWFALLDDWGAAGRRHPEIARWLAETHGVAGWWAQGITVDYERARGKRDVHQVAAGYSVSVSRTIAAPADRLLDAFTDPAVRQRWLSHPVVARPTRAARTARFDWPDPPSRITVTITPRGDDRATVGVQHERLPDANAAAGQKADWRRRLDDLRSLLAGPRPLG